MADRIKVVDVKCNCGQKLAKYEKVGNGRLIKMYLDKIKKDYTGELFDVFYENGDNINCPKCEKKIATVKRVHGKLAAWINQNTVKKVTT